MTKRQGRNTEVNAYRYILNDLETLGWNIISPAQSESGQVYTQRQCLDEPRIKAQLGKDHPENIVKLSEDEFYVIEAKHEINEIDKALSEAENDYGKEINKNRQIKAKIVSGVAGNESEGYLVKSKFLEGNNYKTIKVNGHELTSLVSPKIAKMLLHEDSAEIRELPANEKEFLQIADKINSILHEGAISADNRGSVMASLILTFLDNTPIDINQETSVLIASINAKVEAVLKRSGKPDFYPFLEIKLPRSTTNHFKFKAALVDTLKELRNLNIPSAMNSGDDLLGKFFEVFLKYGNWAKDVGIVFTPRHITKFATEVLDITASDIVYDPTCGTGGFLVGVFDYVKNKFPSKIEVFRSNNIFGTEYQDGVIALAIVNMIFRNDGKTNLEGVDCFSKWLNQKRNGQIETAEYIDTDKPTRIPPVTKVLMNPPFSQPRSENKEYKFINHALKQMVDGGILFSILPTGVMVKQGQFYNWRRNFLLRENTLIAVIDFPDDLFYPIGTVTCGIIVKKGIPHPSNQKVLWIKINEDGLLKSKGKRLPSDRTKNELEQVKELVKGFIKNQDIAVPNIKEFQKAVAIEMDDPTLELLPEVYLDEKRPTEAQLLTDIENTLRESVAFMIQDNRINEFKQNVVSQNQDIFRRQKQQSEPASWKETVITEIFKTPLTTGYWHVSSMLDEGKIPLVSCSNRYNGFEGKFDIPADKTLKNAITIASDGQPLATYYHYYPFSAKDNVIIGIPNKNYRFTTMLFFTVQLNSLQWRYSYGRKSYLNKIHKIKIWLPLKEDGNLDEDYIENLFKKAPSWKTLETLIN